MIVLFIMTSRVSIVSIYHTQMFSLVQIVFICLVSIFLIIRIFEKNVEFYGKTFKLLAKRYLSIFCIIHVNEENLNQQVCLIKYVEQ